MSLSSDPKGGINILLNTNPNPKPKPISFLYIRVRLLSTLRVTVPKVHAKVHGDVPGLFTSATANFDTPRYEEKTRSVAMLLLAYYLQLLC